MTFAYQIRYNRLFHQVIHRGGESEINFIKIFQNYKNLEISVGNSYSEDQLMQNLLDNFQQGGKFSDHITSHQVELSREKNKFIDQQILSISDLQIVRNLSYAQRNLSSYVRTVRTF